MKLFKAAILPLVLICVACQAIPSLPTARAVPTETRASAQVADGATAIPETVAPTATGASILQPMLTPTLVLRPAAATSPTVQAPTHRVPTPLSPTPLYAAWPPPLLTRDQLRQVDECKFDALIAERYPDKLGAADLARAYRPVSACDWAVLAAAHAQRATAMPLPEAGRAAALEAIKRNSAFAFATPLVYGYFDAIPLAKAPPFAAQEITTAEIRYSWKGLAPSTSFTITIRQADKVPQVAVTTDPPEAAARVKGNLDKSYVQALGPSLTDLFPIDSQFRLLVCTDNYADWNVSLTFKDGTVLDLATNGSNLIYVGGPLQAKIKGQNYVQLSANTMKALYELITALELKLGGPSPMACFKESMLDKAFPHR